MRFDKPEHQKFIAELFDAVNIPTKAMDLALEVREAIRNASIGPGCDLDCGRGDTTVVGSD